jgi:hypothetical protein
MTTFTFSVRKRDEIEVQIQSLLASLGEGRVDGVAYDTAWTARLALRYPHHGFDQSLEWLRRHQYTNGTWGAPLTHYHDRYISTLAAIVALQEALKEGNAQPRDARRVKRGEDALWKLVGKLGRDDADTVGFPILATALTEEAVKLGLDVPLPPRRYAVAYNKKVDALLRLPVRDWTSTTLSYSLEGLRKTVLPNDIVLAANNSISSSPAATSAYLLDHKDERMLSYLSSIQKPDGAYPLAAPLEIFEITWALNYLFLVNALDPNDDEVRRLIEYLWQAWSPQTGLPFSVNFCVADLDTTAAGFIVLTWAGYDVSPDVFKHFESENHFATYKDETNLSIGAHLRLLMALEMCPDYPETQRWKMKIINALRFNDTNGSFWWDKWNMSAYYINHLAAHALRGTEEDLRYSRLKWIMKTQNDDGGWGYLGKSTAEETAYALGALLTWQQDGNFLDQSIITSAVEYLNNRSNDDLSPLWISKSLYKPPLIVEALLISTTLQVMRIGGS